MGRGLDAPHLLLHGPALRRAARIRHAAGHARPGALTGLKSRDLASTSSASWASTFDALQPISLDFFLLNDPNLNGEAVVSRRRR